MTPAFEKWLREHVTDADRRAALADAADGLVDLYNAERIDLEDVLTISAWPAFARNRFLRAWQALRDAGRAAALAADEETAELVLPAGPGNPPTVETRGTQTPGGLMAPARPAPNATPPPPREVALLGAPKRRDRSIVGPSLGPRDARGCFPCPIGCPRTFAHAPAAVQHAKSCAAGGGAELTEAEVAAPRRREVARRPQRRTCRAARPPARARRSADSRPGTGSNPARRAGRATGPRCCGRAAWARRARQARVALAR